MNSVDEKIKYYMEEIERDNLFFSQLWKIENERDREEIGLRFAEFALSFAKEGTKRNGENRRILDSMNNWDALRVMHRYGIFGRIYCRIYEGQVLFNYCVGQDYTSERAIIRKLLAK